MTSSINPAQASLLAALLAEQSQAAAVSALSGDTTATDASGASQGTDFASLLAALTGTPSTTSADPLLAALTGADPLAGLTGSLPASLTGANVAAVASQLAGDLTGPSNRSYDPAATPAAAQAVWNAPGWGNGNVQCVAFVAGAFSQAGTPLPATPNAGQFWSAYATQPGWTETANGQGLPQPGDILAMSGGPDGLGHVAVVTAVVPPTNGQPGRVLFAQSNAGSAQGELTLAPDGTTLPWPGYSVQGYIRPASSAGG